MMAGELRLRRGTTAQHETFTGALGEATVDTEAKALMLHDGTTAGGFVAGHHLYLLYIVDMITAPKREGVKYTLSQFWGGTGRGGGQFTWNASRPKTDHDGILVIDPDKVGELGFIGVFNNYFNPAASGVGCFEREVESDPSPLWAGAVGDNVTDDTLPVTQTFLAADSISRRVDPSSRTYKLTTEVTLPRKGFSGGGSFLGAKCRWYKVKNVSNANALLTFDDLDIDSVWDSSFNGKINVNNDLTLYSSDPVWGTFWNEFGDWYVGGELIFDCDQGQSVNHNGFGNVRCRGGVRIRGVNTTGVNECHANRFKFLDTTGANMTAADSSTGWHVLNESVRNQTNHIEQWYAEGSGKRAIRGAWHLIGSNIDASTTPIAIDHRHNYLNSNNNTSRNDGDYLAASLQNDAIGGEWDVLNGTIPYSLGTFGTLISSTEYGASGCPSGINKEFVRETTNSFCGFQINFNYTTAKRVTLCLWYRGDDFQTIESDGGTFTNGVPYQHSSGWKLLRVTVDNVTSWIRLYFNTSGTSFKRISINSYFATANKVCVLPTKREKTVVRGKALNVTSGSTTSISLPRLFSNSSNTNIAAKLKIRISGDAGGPAYIGVVGFWEGLVASNRYGTTTKTTSVVETAEVTQGINTTTSYSINVTGTAGGVNLTVTGGGYDPIDIYWEMEPLDFV